MTIKELKNILGNFPNEEIEVFIQEYGRSLKRIETVILDEKGTFGYILGEGYEE